MSEMDIVLYRDQPPEPVVDGCVRTYAAAFGQPPYHESAADAELLRERIARYAGRAGFQLLVAAEAGQVIGFALAVRAFPGDWWRDKVAGAIGAGLAGLWLPPGVLEVVHVAVDPARQRQGVGRALLASLVPEYAASGGVLSCDPAALPAQQLYLSAGWRLITDQLSYLPGMPARWLMGIEPRHEGGAGG
jgi:GNAT superfamily N-acetyltransferase